MAGWKQNKDGTFTKIKGTETKKKKWKQNKDGTFSEINTTEKSKPQTTKPYGHILTNPLVQSYARKQEAEVKKSLLPYQFSNKDEEGNVIGGLTFEQVQEEKKKYKEGSEEYKYLNNYTGYTNLNDIQKALKEERKPFVYQGTKMDMSELFANNLVPKVSGSVFFPNTQIPRKNTGDGILQNAQVGNIDYSGILNPNNKSVSNNMTLIEALGYDLGNAFDLARKDSTNGSEKTALPYERVEPNESYIKELEKLKTEREKDHLFEYYEHYMDAKDFEENSTYKKEKAPKKKYVTDLSYIEDIYECAKLDESGKTKYISKKASYYLDGRPDIDHLTLLREMTDEEIEVFYYIYNKEGKKEAEKYFNELKPNLNRRLTNTVVDNTTKLAHNYPITMSTLSIPLSIQGGITGGLDTLYSKAIGKEIDIYSGAYMSNAMTNAIRQTVGQDIAEATEGWEVFGTNVPSFLYQTGMSMSDTIVGGALLGKGYSIVAGSNAYQTKARELYEAGEDAETIERTALLTGVTEVAFEYISLDKLLKQTSTVGAKQVFKNALKQAGVEAQEELFTEIANIWIDNLSRGDSSNFAQMRKSLEEQGYSEGEIKSKIAGQVARQLIEATVGGAISGGGLGGGKGFVNNLSYTKTEKQFINDTVQEQVEAKEKESGKKVTNKERQKIQDQVVKDLINGEFSRDEIEKRFGGDSYTEYQQLVKDRNEYKELNKLKKSELTGEQEEKLYNFRKTNNEKSYDDRLIESRLKLAETVANNTKGSKKLDLTYGERGQRGVKFSVSEEDMQRYSEKEREIVQKAIDYGEMNNTRKAHEFVDLVAKLSADKGVSFDFTNNEKLKNSGFAIEGKIINGFKSGKNIVVNMQSTKALNTVVGHEITHILEGTELYGELQKAVIGYAKKLGVYDSKYADIVRLYRNQFEGKNTQTRKALYDSELTADLVGEYIFNDVDFVRNLHANNPNVFKKIYNEIKYMLKKATIGSDAERQLLKAKKIFEDVYRDTNTNTNKDMKYSMSDKNSKNGKDYAPTFYSHMGKVVDDIKQDKIGANSVVSYLKGKGVKNEEIKWSGIETFLEGKKSVTKAELQEFVAGSQLQVEESTLSDDNSMKVKKISKNEIGLYDGKKLVETFEKEIDEEDGSTLWHPKNNTKEYYVDSDDILKEYARTNFSEYKIEGGKNYKELLFKLPNNDYTNLAMRKHWGRSVNGESAKGIFAHARIQDIKTKDGKHMLFIDEIQSDWHNEGHKKGYKGDAETSSNVQIKKVGNNHLGTPIWALFSNGVEVDSVYAETEAEARNELKERMDVEVENAEKNLVPEAPFKDTYHEYVLKRLLRMASEEGYDSIGWTTGKIQEDRWSEKYAEGYRIEYDQDIPKFLKKYGKKWGATVGQTQTKKGDTIWSMDITDSMKQSVLHEGQPQYSLSTDNKGRTLTKEQQEKFKDSVVRDENGNLLTMYHGTPNGDYTIFREGTYFTQNKEYADVYQSQGASSLGYKKTANNPKTYEVYLDIKKPFDTRNPKERAIFENEYFGQWGMGTPLMESGLPDWLDGEDLREFLEEKGYDYDGLILDEGAVGGYGDEVKSRGVSYVVFNPNQVKNVENTKPTDNADIRFSLSENGNTTDKNIKHEVTDFYSGEMFAKLSYEQDGKVVGTLEYSEYDGEPSVKMVEVDEKYRRKGIGTKLLQELQRKYPDTEINMGMTTEDGTKLLDNITYTVENKEVVDKFARAKELESKLAEYDETYEKFYNDEIELEENYAEDYNEVYDELVQLKKELRRKKPTKRLVKTDPDVQYSLSNDTDTDGNNLTIEQSEYFKDSKVRDDKGNLLTLYHGTTSTDIFTEFNHENGVWLSTDYDYAKEYSGWWNTNFYSEGEGLGKDVYADNNLRIYEMYADIKNPFVLGEINGTLSDGKVSQLANALGHYVADKTGDMKRGGTVAREVRELAKDYVGEKTYQFTRTKEFIDFAKKHGFDGFVATEDGKKTYCVFDSANQVKLVTNQNPTDNADIRYSLSDNSKPIAPTDGWNITSEDVALERPIAPKQSVESNNITENIAPIGENVAQTHENAPINNREVQGMETLPLPQDNVKGVRIQKGMKLPTKQTSTEKVQKPTKSGKEIRSWAETSTESEAVDGAIKIEDLDQDVIHYEPISNKKTLERANNKLDSFDSYENAMTYFNSQMSANKVDLVDLVMGERLLQEAIKRKDTKGAGELIQNIAVLGTELGQKVQALSIIQRLTPEGQLKVLNKIVNRGKAKGDKIFRDVELTDSMQQQILDAYNEDGSYDQDKLNSAIENVKQELADQMGVTAMEKVNAWRMFSMLGNPKTHGRNIISNATMYVVREAKNVIARTIEGGVDASSKMIAPINPKLADKIKLDQRTKTWKRATEDVKTYAEESTKNAEAQFSGEHRGTQGTTLNDIKAKRKMFKTNILQKVYGINSDALQGEDTFFKRPVYRRSLQEFLTANGIKSKDDIKNNAELVSKGEKYAMEQCLFATFQQDSAVAEWIGNIERKNVGTQIAIGSVLPFKKTPINIAKTGLAYSPLGFTKTLAYDIPQVVKGKMDASQLIDNISQATTGTALMLTGYLLSSIGFLNGGGDDDKEGKYDDQLGEQAYSINIGGKSYSLSWLTPASMPLFIGANLNEVVSNGEDLNFDATVDALASTLDPMSEMSFMSSLDTVLSSYEKGMGKWAGVVENAGQSYLSQFIPTLSSQIAQITDSKKRSTSASADSDARMLEQTARKLMYKIPILRNMLEPTIDIHGNEVKQNENLFVRGFESLIAPYNTKDYISDEVDEEIKKLYSQTGDGRVIPSVPSSSIQYKGESYKMSAKEYTEYKKIYGQTANKYLRKLFATSTYKNATIEEQNQMAKEVYDYARDIAHKEYLKKENVKYTNTTEDNVPVYKENPIKGAIENDMSLDEYKFMLKYQDKYDFLQENDISYDEYRNNKDEYDIAYKNPDKYNFLLKNEISYKEYSASKDLYNWAYENQEQYEIAKTTSIGVKKYYNHKKVMNKISGENKKERIKMYLNNLDIDSYSKVMLFKSVYPKDNTYKGY